MGCSKAVPGSTAWLVPTGHKSFSVEKRQRGGVRRMSIQQVFIEHLVDIG